MNRDRINELYAGKIFSFENQETARERIHWICRQVIGNKILDVGCSQGIVCLLLGREGFNCIGVDNEQGAIDYANKELDKEESAVREKVIFQTGEGSSLPFENDYFDTVILTEILEHLVQPERVLSEIKRVLRNGGKVVVTVPYGLNPDPDHKRSYYPFSLLETVMPFFTISNIGSIKNYITYVGVKDENYNSKNISPEEILINKLQLHKDVEKRFEQKEKEFLDKSIKLYDKINKLNEHISQLSNFKKEHGKEIKIQGQDIERLTQEREKLKQELVAQKIYFIHTWRWRFGSIFVGGAILLRNFISHPVQFIKQADTHFKIYFRNIFPPSPPPSAPPKKAEQTLSEITQTPLVKVKLHKLIEGKLNLGTIFDEFTASCFVPECNLITFRPDNWKETLEEYPPQGIFVESAWRGNSGAWQYRVAKYAKNMGNELHDLLKWAEKKKLPTIFWNKEDPPHYERFIDKAKLFDYVFTSDADCIPQYNKDLGHSRIFALPFAAQPKIHNPILKNVREHNVCFAGTYYGWSHEERRQDMKFILKPSLNFGLHIFDRQFGMTGPEAEQFRFPDIYQSSIKGRLDYEDMIKAYKNYKVFLNINSVKTSPTMFSRRVFELLACGTPVISTYSKGIEELLGSDLVFITESEADTNRFLEKLCNDDDYWSQVSVKGIRKVMEEHTYAQRLHFIAQVTGLSKEAIDLPHFTVVSNIENPKQLKNIQASLKRQTYRNFNVFLLLDKSIDNGKIVELRNSIPDIKVTCDSFKQGKTCKDYQQEIHGEYLTVFSARDMYGANYLKDYALAKMYCDYDYIGRSSYYVASPDAKLNNSDKEFQFVAQVPKATLAVRKEVVADENLSTLTGSGLFTQEEGKILSLDRFNYIEMQNETKPSDSLLRAIDV